MPVAGDRRRGVILRRQPGPEQAEAMSESGRRKVEANYLDPALRSNLDSLIDDLQAKPVAGRFEIWLVTRSGQVAADGQPIICSQFCT